MLQTVGGTDSLLGNTLVFLPPPQRRIRRKERRVELYPTGQAPASEARCMLGTTTGFLTYSVFVGPTQRPESWSDRMEPGGCIFNNFLKKSYVAKWTYASGCTSAGPR